MIHQFKNNGYDIVLDVCSGSVHVVDDLVYDLIEIYEGRSREEVVAELEKRLLSDSSLYAGTEGELCTKKDIEEAYDAVTALKDAGQLFTEDEFKQPVIDFKKRKTVVKALCLNVSHDCNLACKYCFAGQGEYNGDKALMSFEVGKQALDFLVANSGNRTNLEVDFFGGEPLMNLDVCKQLVAYGRSIEEKAGKKFRFTLTTNGILLNDDFVEFANKELKNVVLSLDGRKSVNDFMRPTVNGKGSYDIIVPKFKKFAEKRKGEFYLRGTFTHNNLDFCEDVITFMDEGFRVVSMEPVVASPDQPYAIKEEDVPIICEQYDKLAKVLIERAKEGEPVTFFHFMIDLSAGPCVYKRLSGCGTGTEYLAVTPWGDLYPCHQFVGNEDFKLGNVFDGIEREDIVEEFKCCNVYAKDKCKDCFARFYCSGGCAANAYQFHGTILDAYDIGCELERKRVECALMMKAALSDIPGVQEMQHFKLRSDLNDGCGSECASECETPCETTCE